MSRLPSTRRIASHHSPQSEAGLPSMIRLLRKMDVTLAALQTALPAGPAADPEQGSLERDAPSLGLLAVDLGHDQFLPVGRAGDFEDYAATVDGFWVTHR